MVNQINPLHFVFTPVLLYGVDSRIFDIPSQDIKKTICDYLDIFHSPLILGVVHINWANFINQNVSLNKYQEQRVWTLM